MCYKYKWQVALRLKRRICPRGAVLCGFGGITDLKMRCCEITYSTTDPATFNCFDKYEVKPLSKDYIGKEKVYTEIVYVLNCFNNCTKIEVLRYGRVLGVKKLIKEPNREQYHGKEAIDYLERTIAQRTFKDIPCPGKKQIYVSSYIPLAFGKALDATTQRPRYLNEQDWQNKWQEGITCKSHKGTRFTRISKIN